MGAEIHAKGDNYEIARHVPTHKMILCTGQLQIPPKNGNKRLFLVGENKSGCDHFWERIKDIEFPRSFEEAED